MNVSSLKKGSGLKKGLQSYHMKSVGDDPAKQTSLKIRPVCYIEQLQAKDYRDSWQYGSLSGSKAACLRSQSRNRYSSSLERVETDKL
jgi:hypothetical protein